MSNDYTLYYWPIPFRGQFVRALLAFAGAAWDEADPDAVAALRAADVGDQPVPCMGPPVLYDHDAGLYLAQMPAILSYLGDKFGMMPSDAGRVALTHKVIADTNDVLDNLTRSGGAQMWTRGEWEGFISDRLPRWMRIFEELGKRQGLEAGSGFMLGADAPGLADLVTATLWGTMVDKLPGLRPVLQTHAPRVAGLCARIGADARIAELQSDTDRRFGELYCGGQIEASIREMLA